MSYEIGAIISTHAPAGGATMRSGQLSRRSFISTHAPAGGATRAVPVYRTRPQKPFLLTPLREGRRAAEIYSVATKKISTHAPAGGATDAISPAGMNVDISTHAPAGGATGSLAAHEAYLGISTHAPAGGATASHVLMFCIFLISTHAPAGGATFTVMRSPSLIIHFYSRPCGRGDKTKRTICKSKFKFLLTPLREGRPRAHEAPSTFSFISTHAPAGGATPQPGQV